jgi:hypothetical protein
MGSVASRGKNTSIFAKAAAGEISAFITKQLHVGHVRVAGEIQARHSDASRSAKSAATPESQPNSPSMGSVAYTLCESSNMQKAAGDEM